MLNKSNMADKFDKELLSAFMDGESQDQSLLERVENDPALETVWQDFHLIGDVMRGEGAVAKEWDIAGKVALALENEPAHSVVAKPVDVSPQVIPMESQPTPFESKRTLPAWLRNLGQVATAACVSLVAIFGVQQYNNSAVTDAEIPSAVPVLETVPFAGSAEPVSLTAHSAQQSVNIAPTEAQLMEQRKRINAMLQDYELQLRLNASELDADQTQQENQVQVD
uniref:RseA family anti-sigma factor n=1 Tax=Thaumasiovibrio occultus TaxID=1891184 RepID=UPI000B34ABA2|nr:RseA family anti-sigma factor [Thaumasiovibrio occultus]